MAAWLNATMERLPPSLIPRVKELLERELARVAGLRWAVLFGSAARGEAFADVDLAIMPAPGAFEGLVDACGLGAELARKLGIQGLSVEVIDLRSAALPCLGALLDEASLLLDREPAARRFWEAEVTLRWLDFQPLWDLNDRLRRQRLAEGGWSSASEL